MALKGKTVSSGSVFQLTGGKNPVMTGEAERCDALPWVERVARAVVGVQGNGQAPPERAPSSSQVLQL